LLIRKKIF